MEPQPDPSAVVNITSAIGIQVGGKLACALLASNTVECWGYNVYGQLGIGQSDQDAHSTPAIVSNLESIEHVSPRGFSACALRTDGHVWCWGDNTYGALGAPLSSGDSYSAVAVEVPGLSNVVSVDGSGCAVQADATVACWGDNSSGQIGPGDDNTPVLVVPTPMQLPNLIDATQVAVGYFNICLAQRNGDVQCAGDNSFCEVDLGCATQADVRTFTLIPGLSHVKKLAVGAQFACAIGDDDRLYCWGRNFWGELGRGNNDSAPLYPATIEPVKWP
jgi:alpha-tubulin suppressor-like RCC1 family protein